jgi:hypothetical protein
MLKDHERFIPFIAKLFKGERKVFIVDLSPLNNLAINGIKRS